jgi:putative transposase
MTEYRRHYVPGGTFFFTVNIAERSKSLLVDRIDALRMAFRTVKAELPFQIDAIVILPEHLHALWTLPAGDADYSTRWKRIKDAFTKAFPKTERRSASRMAKGERGIWQRRFWDHSIRDEADYARHFDYIHYNPVKHGWVRQVKDWPHSSFHRYVRQGLYPSDWGGTAPDSGDGEFGERGE